MQAHIQRMLFPRSPSTAVGPFRLAPRSGSRIRELDALRICTGLYNALWTSLTQFGRGPPLSLLARTSHRNFSNWQSTVRGTRGAASRRRFKIDYSSPRLGFLTHAGFQKFQGFSTAINRSTAYPTFTRCAVRGLKCRSTAQRREGDKGQLVPTACSAHIWNLERSIPRYILALEDAQIHSQYFGSTVSSFV